jgi:hypothetical protein
VSVDWLIAGSLIDELRNEECVAVSICSDNADFNDLPNCVVGVEAPWTNWKLINYRGDTVVECLLAAKRDRKERQKP